MYRLNIYERVKHFRETLAKSINESGLSAEVIHIVSAIMLSRLNASKAISRR